MYAIACVAIQRFYKLHRKYLAIKLGKDRFLRRGKIRFFDKRADAAAVIQRSWKKFLVRTRIAVFSKHFKLNKSIMSKKEPRNI